MNFKSYLIEFSNYWKGNGSVSFIWPFPLNFARNESKSLHNVLKEKKSPISTILAVKKNFFVVKSWNILYTIVKIFCSSVEFFVQSGNILWCVEIFCAVCKYFAQVWKYSIWKSANLCSNWIFQIRSELVVDMQMAPGSHSLVITIIQPHRNTNTNINTNTNTYTNGYK